MTTKHYNNNYENAASAPATILQFNIRDTWRIDAHSAKPPERDKKRKQHKLYFRFININTVNYA